MLFECPAGLGAVRLNMVALGFGGAMREPPFGGEVFGLLACGAFSRNTKVDDFSHGTARRRISSRTQRANCADTVARTQRATHPCQNAVAAKHSKTRFSE